LTVTGRNRYACHHRQVSRIGLIRVGADHEALQQRRREQQTPEFKRRMHQRNGIEGTLSELVRAHGLRRARYRGFVKVDLQNHFIAAACNVKRWLEKLINGPSQPENAGHSIFSVNKPAS
jgi:IS5 family transposase